MPRSSEEERERLFIAVPLPEHLLSRVQEVQRALPAISGLRLLKPEQLHVTLAFMGHVGAAKREAAERIVEMLPADVGGVAEMDGFLFIPSAARPRVVALRIDDGAGIFARVFEQVMSRLEEAGVMKREKRPFMAHLTIARLRRPTRVQPKYECEPVPYPVQSVCLYRSELRREGAQYTVLARREFETGPAGYKENEALAARTERPER